MTRPWCPELEVRTQKRRGLGLACMWSAFAVPAKGLAQDFVDSTDRSVAASSCRRPTRRSSRLQERRVARLSQADSYCANRQEIRLQVNGVGGASAEHDGDRNGGNSSDSRFLTGGAAQQGGKQDGGIADRWSSLPGWRQSWWRCCAKAIVGTPPCGAARADCSARCSCSLISCWTSVGSRGGVECPCC